MTEDEAKTAAVRLAAKTGYAFMLYWPKDDNWTVAETKPSLRAPGMKIIEVAEDGREYLT